MKPSYSDITSLIPQPPIWYDENGVPRYAPFRPDLLGVYIKYALYAQIACQSCGTMFLIGEGYNPWGESGNGITAFTENDFRNRVAHYHYGDPPNHGCVGDSMNSELVTVLETWARVLFEWTPLDTVSSNFPEGL